MDDARLDRLNHPTRRRMLEAAEACFARDGYDAARVDDIAARAGVSKSHLYYHFPGKAELLSSLVHLRTAEMIAAKDALMPPDLTAAPTDRDDPLATMLEQAVTEILRPRRDFLRVVLVEAIRNPGAARPVFDAFQTVLDDSEARLRTAGLDGLPDNWRDLALHLGLIPMLYLVAVDGDGAPAERTSGIVRTVADLERALVPGLRRNDA